MARPFLNAKLRRGVLLAFVLISVWGEAQTIKPIRYGNLDSWVVRYIKESGLLGGKTKTLYAVGPVDTIAKNEPFVYGCAGNPWSCSNAYANVMGIAKGSCTAKPEKRDKGYCARLETIMETVKVAGMVNISVVVPGTLFLGETIEPVRSPNNPYKNINMGIPFTQKPQAVMFDYKALISDEHKIQKALGFGVSELEGHDEAEVYVFLQKRWEDERGNIYSKRVGTAFMRIDKTVPEWVNGFQLPIYYGDITTRADYKSYMGLERGDATFCARNSTGKMVEIQEVGWGTSDDEPTHIVLMLTAGCYPAFYGHVGNKLWVDNVKLVY